MKTAKDINVLIACEESQAVCKAFRELGFNAFSNDIQECSGGYPEWHLQMDCFEAIALKDWDLMIAFPPCTFLSYVGEGWFNVEKYKEKAIKRLENRKKAEEFFIKIYNSNIKYIAIENPRGSIMKAIKPTQYIHPYYFGDNHKKLTCLWLKNLPSLIYAKNDNLFINKTATEEPKSNYIDRSGKKRYFTDSFWPSKDRGKLRSKTFPGIAKAMAEQWGEYILNDINNII